MRPHTPTLLAAIALLAGCGTVPATTTPQEIDFVRGCWVAKAPPAATIQGFLRLLPSGPDRDSLEGQITPANPDASSLPRMCLFSRDGVVAGSTMTTGELPAPTMDMESAQLRNAPALPSGWKRASWVTPGSGKPTSWLVAEGDDEHIAIYMFYDPPITVTGSSRTFTVPKLNLFDGERDGCD